MILSSIQPCGPPGTGPSVEAVLILRVFLTIGGCGGNGSASAARPAASHDARRSDGRDGFPQGPTTGTGHSPTCAASGRPRRAAGQPTPLPEAQRSTSPSRAGGDLDHTHRCPCARRPGATLAAPSAARHRSRTGPAGTGTWWAGRYAQGLPPMRPAGCPAAPRPPQGVPLGPAPRQARSVGHPPSIAIGHPASMHRADRSRRAQHHHRPARKATQHPRPLFTPSLGHPRSRTTWENAGYLQLGHSPRSLAALVWSHHNLLGAPPGC